MLMLEWPNLSDTNLRLMKYINNFLMEKAAAAAAAELQKEQQETEDRFHSEYANILRDVLIRHEQQKQRPPMPHRQSLPHETPLRGKPVSSEKDSPHAPTPETTWHPPPMLSDEEFKRIIKSPGN